MTDVFDQFFAWLTWFCLASVIYIVLAYRLLHFVRRQHRLNAKTEGVSSSPEANSQKPASAWRSRPILLVGLSLATMLIALGPSAESIVRHLIGSDLTPGSGPSKTRVTGVSAGSSSVFSGNDHDLSPVPDPAFAR